MAASPRLARLLRPVGRVHAAFFAALGVGHPIAAFRRGIEAEAAYWKGFAWVALALAALVLSIWLGGGLILGSTLLFTFTARASGRKALLADVLLGFVLAFGIFFLFNKLLTLALPIRPLERLL